MASLEAMISVKLKKISRLNNEIDKADDRSRNSASMVRQAESKLLAAELRAQKAELNLAVELLRERLRKRNNVGKSNVQGK